MGWVHAILTILAVIGSPPVISSLLFRLEIYRLDIEREQLYYDILNTLEMALILAPAPVVIGITIGRKKVFGEQPRADGRMTLPAMVTVAILGMWWLLPSSGLIRLWTGW